MPHKTRGSRPALGFTNPRFLDCNEDYEVDEGLESPSLACTTVELRFETILGSLLTGLCVSGFGDDSRISALFFSVSRN